MSELCKRVGKKLNKLRTEKNISMRELGKDVGISHSYISQIENGKHYPSIELLEIIAEYFGVDVSMFFVEENDSLHKWIHVIEKFEERDVTPEEVLAFQIIMRKINSK